MVVWLSLSSWLLLVVRQVLFSGTPVVPVDTARLTAMVDSSDSCRALCVSAMLIRNVASPPRRHTLKTAAKPVDDTSYMVSGIDKRMPPKESQAPVDRQQFLQV